MTRYLIVSKKFSGFLIYGFNRDGYLIEFRNCTWDIDEQTMQNILVNLALMLTFKKFKEFTDTYEMDVRRIDSDLSFEAWYRMYDMARDRKEAREIWERFEKAAQRGHIAKDLRLRAFWVAEAYDRYLTRFGLDRKMYPKSFLSSHLEDEFDKLKEKQKN